MPPNDSSEIDRNAVPAANPARFAALYLVAALVWLLTTDWLVLYFFPESTTAQTLKGVVFMLMSAGIVWGLVHQSARSLRRRNASLARETAFSNSIIASSPIPVIVLDTDARVVLWSPAAMSLFGWEEQQAAGCPLPCFEAGHEVWSEALWSRVASGERVDAVECAATTNTGQKRHVSLSVAPLFDGDDQFVGAIVMLNDITNQRDALERLRVSERRLRRLFDGNPRPMWTYDLDTLRLTSVNRAAIEHYGFSEAEFLSMSIFDVRPEDEHERLRAALGSPRKRLERSAEWRHRTRDGRVIEVESDSHLLEIEGRTVALVVINDVTERNRLERENARIHGDLREMTGRLLRSQEEERRRIARELHDESGALLTALQACIGMARRALVPGNETVARELEEAASITSDLAGHMRHLATSLLPGVLDDLGLAPAVGWFIDRYSRQAGIRVDFSHDLPAGTRFSAETETVGYRVVQEALTNIARHADTRTAQVVLNRSDEVLEIHVLDDGKGFDPDDAMTRGSLGLHGMRERCAMVGGRVTIVSAPGEGTRVSVTLPVGPG